MNTMVAFTTERGNPNKTDLGVRCFGACGEKEGAETQVTGANENGG